MENYFHCPILGLCDTSKLSDQELFRATNWYEEEIESLSEKLETLKKEKKMLDKVKVL